MSEKSQPIFSRRFIQLCISSLLFFASFNMIIPKLYDYILTLEGGSNVNKGLAILTSFTLIALLSRPFSGKLVESIGRVPVMFIGSFASCIAALLYPLVATVPLFIVLRMFHGLSTGYKPTGSAAMIADIIPNNRRGEAMGYLGFMGSTGMALGPWIGSSIYNTWGYYIMFFASSFVAFLSLLVIINIKDTVAKKDKDPINLQLIKLRKYDLFEKRVWLPALVYLLYTLAYGTVYNLATDYGEDVFHIKNIGIFFLFTVFFSIVSRLIAGRVSDKIGRIQVVLVGLILFLISLFIFAFATNVVHFYFGASVFGFAVGIISPAMFAWVTDLSLQARKGRAFSTLYMAMEAGIGIGAFWSGLMYQNILSHIPSTIAYSSIFVIAAIVLILWKWKKYINFVQ